MIFISCVFCLHACKCMHCVHSVPMVARRGFPITWNWIIDVCEPLRGCKKLNKCSLAPF